MRTAPHGPCAETLADAALIASKVFEAMEWRWARSFRGEFDVPDAEGILQLLQHLAEVAVQGEGCASSGRLCVEVDEDGDAHVSIDIGSPHFGGPT